MSENKPVRRRRRADADRSRTAILDAAVVLLDEQPDASLERIAEVARVTRQTVYAHFSSREVLLNAVLDELTRETLEGIDALGLDEGPALDKLLRLINLSWRMFEQHPLLLHVPQTADERHDPVIERFVKLIRRGQRAGEITRELPVDWLVTALIALGHAAGESVAAGRLSTRTASKTLNATITRLLKP
ncbi:TetR/AcrR family transcriptional regulator [Kribbella sp. NBC_00709]|uniref:TetR/AcrR family transcriptional regulator n=1 Tax=Kribbella sp. NBC_00709 TaxID=2975972 RepID=UPI002E2B4161|nr:TetR/AcrR family transcriptional regulator [Kribbella sp. NBC_00709]